ncbi:AI-2E family transporter [Umezakia ovalisporum]|jgi:predicted PurR-regulated permease PerM|uniref:AI-2E family transporter n=2 Tax=Umezakia ovalisporum TaxID=75695 RepID=A0AA43GYS6_9CYAN|nr:AI-2E family transporter [Umezakia ovalisporum]MBI1240283.1 AI-2E family transporter [Nostoc sp. RI_552]MDH6057260.1 AI-2E family transporter [Umezakia ovalisporum FSS-43]MDH6063620.1 AI-2E family transporter [Umezakia ovalisporum FSS-62]MDH6068784.1 AI-2E family transporter [Umezakia ovalisporum APH033B]MDH6070273.1 AI-2E family transporter [Umezakia ovalisporum CobakiLakeA]
MNEPRIKRFWEKLNNIRLIRYVLLLALGWAIVQVFAYFSTVIVIFIFAAILAFLLSYPVKWCERFLPHGIAVIIVFLSSLLVLGGLMATLGFAILSQFQQLLEQAPQFVDYVISLLNTLQNILIKFNLKVNFQLIQEELRNQILSGIGTGWLIFQVLLSNLVDLILIAVVAFFMLLDGKKVWDFVVKGFAPNVREKLTLAVKQNFLGFFWGRLLLSLFFGISVFVVFILLELPYALFLAAIAGVFDLIPGIGATIGIILVALIVLPQGIWFSVQVIIACIILQQVEENLLMPRIMQGSINMNPVFMFFALLIGARVAGLVGIFLSIPLAGVLISMFKIEEMQGGS